jgi:hypothetical protein
MVDAFQRHPDPPLLADAGSFPQDDPLAGTARRLKRTPLAKGSNVGRRSAKACHETSGVGQVEWRAPLAQ